MKIDPDTGLPKGFEIVGHQPTRKTAKGSAASPDLTPTGEAHDGDTYRTRGGANARMAGYDAFELDQEGHDLSGAPIPLGVHARDRFVTKLPGALAQGTGEATYGRPVVNLVDAGGRDVGLEMVDAGVGIPVPKYLASDPPRLASYVAAQRAAIASERGAYAGTYQDPSDYRKQGDAAPLHGKIEMTPTEAQDWEALVRNPTTTPEQAGEWLKSHGHSAENVHSLVRFLSRNPEAEASQYFQQEDAEGNPVQAEPRGFFLRSMDALNEGIIDIVASPFELSHMIAKPVAGALGSDIGDSSLVGTWLRRKWHDLGEGQRDEGSAPQSDAERYFQSFMRGAGSALLPVGGSLSVGGRLAMRAPSLATEASAVRSAVRSSLVDAAKNPGTVVAGELGAGAGSYGGEEAAHDIAPGNPWAAIAGQFIGGVGGGIAAGTAARARSPHVPETGRLPEGYYADETGEAGLHANVTDDSGPTVERGGKQFARAADGAELEIPVDRSGFPGVTMGANGWEALVGVDDGAPMYGPQNVPNASASPYGDLANRLNAPARSMGAPDAVAAAPIAAPEPAPTAPPREADRMAMQADKPELVKYAEASPEAAADVQATLNQVGDGYSYEQALFDIRAKHGKGERPRPLLADPTPEERAQALGRVEPSDLLPIPATRVSGVEEAAAIEKGRFAPVKAPDERAELGRRNLRSPTDGLKTIPKRGPVDLVTWLRTQGGLKPQDSSLAHAGIDNRPRLGMDFAGGEHRFGKLVDPENGLSYEHAAHAAWEAGYFPDYVEPPTIPEFLESVVSTHTGRHRSFLPDDLDEVDRFNAARSQRSDVEAANQDGAPLIEDRGQPVTMDDLEANAAPVQAYEEWGENAPDFAGNIRLDGLDSPQSIKRALVRVDKVDGGFDAARRGRITRAETEALAADLNMKPGDLLKRRKGQALNAEQALAARQILAKSGNELVNMSKRLTAKIARGEASDADMADFRTALVRHAAIQEQVSGATAEAGRALAQFKMTADARAVRGEVLKGLVDGAGGPEGIESAARAIIEASDDPKRLNQAVKALAKPGLKDKAVELYYNFLLSGPRTHAVNITSNLLTSLAQIPEHAIAAMVGTPRALVRGRAADRVLYGELGARTVGLIQGAREGFRQFARTMRTGEPSDAASKVEAQTFRAISGVKGSILRTPTRALMAEDELFKAMARRMEVVGQAVRQAGKEGLSGKAAKARAADLAANPTPQMLDRAAEYGRYVTFQRKLGPGGQAIVNWTAKNPALKLLIPFVRTPINLLKFAVERSPAAPILKEWRDDMKAGGARRDLAAARIVAGTGAAMLVVELANSGMITGGGPPDQKAKRLLEAQGWQPYSVKIGDRYYAYQRLDPFSTTLGLAADYVDQQKGLSEEDRDKLASRLFAVVAQNLSSKTWLASMTNFVEAADDPGRYGERFVASIAASGVPALIGQTAGAVDPIQRDTRGEGVLDTVVNRIRARIPFLSRDLPARRDVGGEKIEASNGGGVAAFSPVFSRAVKNDPTYRALSEAGVTLPAITNSFADPSEKAGDRMKIPASQFEQYQEAVAKQAKPELAALIDSPDWPSMTRDERQKEVERIMRNAKVAARETIAGVDDDLEGVTAQLRPYARGRALTDSEMAAYKATTNRIAAQMIRARKSQPDWVKLPEAAKASAIKEVGAAARAAARDAIAPAANDDELPPGFSVVK